MALTIQAQAGFVHFGFGKGWKLLCCAQLLGFPRSRFRVLRFVVRLTPAY